MDLERIISPERLGPYRVAAGHDLERALALYIWNMKIGASFMPLISTVEIALRNRIVCRLLSVWGETWWDDHAFRELLGEGRKSIAAAKAKFHKRGTTPDSGRITAELTLGFWQSMLLPKYETALWSPLEPHFPDLPATITLGELYTAINTVRDLRNRISHHEPIFNRSVSQDYANAIGLLKMLSRAKAAWIKPHLEVMQVMRQKP